MRSHTLESDKAESGQVRSMASLCASAEYGTVNLCFFVVITTYGVGDGFQNGPERLLHLSGP